MRVIFLAATFLLADCSQAQTRSPEVLIVVTPEQGAANFDKADANKDGRLDRSEFADTPRAKLPNDPNATFAISDADRDGYVSKAEFMARFATPAPASKQ